MLGSHAIFKEGNVTMKRYFISMILFVITVAAFVACNASMSEAAEKTGEQLFNLHCSLCHPDGGNIISPNKTMRKRDLDANNITSPDAAVRIMRKPGPGMTTFDVKTVSDKEARQIAEYMFKKYRK